jgi:hypothetical protein
MMPKRKNCDFMSVYRSIGAQIDFSRAVIAMVIASATIGTLGLGAAYLAEKTRENSLSGQPSAKKPNMNDKTHQCVHQLNF